MDTQQKLEALADASRFDLSCACATQKGEHRVRGGEGKWLYPVSLPSGGTSIMLKTLMSNVCGNQCLYCPYRGSSNVARYSLTPGEIVSVFMDYLRKKRIHGLFLSSGVIRDPDYTMSQLLAVAGILRRKHQFKGYIHLKIIPGVSDAAIEESLRLASAISLNVEAPHRAAFEKLSHTKDFDRDIVRCVRKISELTAPGARFSGVKQTTQFVVGAADETDSEIVKATFGLYRRLRLNRVYYSAYQRGLGDPNLPGEQRRLANPEDALTREHRLYQVDWLMRKYGFSAEEIPFQTDGSLSLQADPKTIWAQRNQHLFPLDVNRAGKFELLRVPGLGPTTVQRILQLRSEGVRFRSAGELLRLSRRLSPATAYLKYG